MSTFQENLTYQTQRSQDIKNNIIGNTKQRLQRSIEKDTPFTESLKQDLNQYKKQLLKIKSDGSSKHQYDQSFNQKLQKTETKNKEILTEKEFQKTPTKNKTNQRHYGINVYTAQKNQARLSLNINRNDQFLTNTQISTLRRNYDRLFNQSMQLRKNRVEWKQYDRVRIQNGELKDKLLKLNQQIMRQRNQIGIAKRQTQNLRNVELKRQQMQNKHLREQLTKFKDGVDSVGNYQMIKLKAERDNLSIQLKHAKDLISKQQKMNELRAQQNQHKIFHQQTMISTKQFIQLQDRISSLRNTNSILQAQIQKHKLKEQQFQKQVASYKKQISALQLQVLTVQIQKNNLDKNHTQLKNENKNLIIQRQSFELNGDIEKVRTEKRQAIRQLEDKMKEIAFLKNKLTDMAESYALKQQNDAELYRQKIKFLEKEIQSYRKGDKNTLNQFDEIIKNQMVDNQKFKQTLHNRSEQVYSLQQQLTVFRSAAENAKTTLDVERVKFLAEKKNLQSICETQKQNIIGQQNVLKKQIDTLKQKIKSMGEENKKKDQFMKNHLIGKIGGSESMKEDVEQFFSKYRSTFSN